jgi:hypothetical protein
MKRPGPNSEATDAQRQIEEVKALLLDLYDMRDRIEHAAIHGDREDIIREAVISLRPLDKLWKIYHAAYTDYLAAVEKLGEQ